ncbi:hypothetical protein HPP92_018398 [Vanilla planifolia]|uniref:Glutaredoxin domain-containing protein n=1 Tax=Vanilla planifolia TaxID=51239 RepID=A0A835Q9Q7_VANPL|nr:hypothetical protein HPP92_018398 [Vanilla planifolia]
MASAVQLMGFNSSYLRCHYSSFRRHPKTIPHPLASSSHEATYLRCFLPSTRRRRKVLGRSVSFRSPFLPTTAVLKLDEAKLVSIPSGSDRVEDRFPHGAGVYGVYDKVGELQFIGISRNVAASIAAHSKALPDLCCSVKVGLLEGDNSDKTVLTDAWKSWLEEHITLTGKIPPGNQNGNSPWVRRPQRKPDLRLTPGRHVQLTVPLEELIDRLVKENEVVAFIKGSRSAPQCGFSQRVVGILESLRVDFECVDVLDEEHNFGLRETLKRYSNWPTFPQVFVRGELIGGCDIISSMAEKGELVALFRK